PKEAQRFFEDNKHLYASLDDIQELHDEVVGAYDREVAKKAGLDLGLDDEGEAAAPPPDEKKLEQRLKDALEEVRKSAPGMDGYYIGENGHLAAILVRTTLPSMDQRAYDLEQLVEKLAEEGGYSKVDPKFRLSFTGN